MQKAEGKGWWTAILIIAIGTVLSVGLLLMLYTRRSHAAAVPPANDVSPEKSAPEPPTSISFSCSSCARNLKAKADLAGKTIKCPACGSAVLVPGTEAIGARRPPKAGLHLKTWQMCTVLVAAVLLIAGAVAIGVQRPKPPPKIGVPLGCEFVDTVQESGFHAQQYDKQSQPLRWTNGHARLVIPIDQKNPPQGLHVHLSPWRPPLVDPPSLRILVNERELFSEQVRRDHWEKTFDLSAINLGNQVIVEILSDTFVPSDIKDGGPDNRTLGVEVRGVELLARLEETKK